MLLSVIGCTKLRQIELFSLLVNSFKILFFMKMATLVLSIASMAGFLSSSRHVVINYSVFAKDNSVFAASLTSLSKCSVL